MYGLYLSLVIYFGIAIGIYIGVCMGTLNLKIQSRATGEFLEPGSKEYEILKLIFSIAWVVMVIQEFERRVKRDGR